MNRRNIVRGIVLVALALTASWLAYMVDAIELVRQVLMAIESLGPWAPILFILAYVVACVTFFPGIVLSLGGGILFGVFQGTLFVTIGAAIGAACAFLIARYAAREWVDKRWGSNPRFQAIDQAVAREGWKIVGLIRLSPVFPFTPLNFLFGLTRIPLARFLVTTWISIIPLTMLYVYIGAVIGDLTELDARPLSSGTLKWVITGLGLASTAVVTFIVTRIAQRALATRLPEADKEKAAAITAANS